MYSSHFFLFCLDLLCVAYNRNCAILLDMKECTALFKHCYVQYWFMKKFVNCFELIIHNTCFQYFRNLLIFLNVCSPKESIFLTTFYNLYFSHQYTHITNYISSFGFYCISTICQSVEYILELYIDRVRLKHQT